MLHSPVKGNLSGWNDSFMDKRRKKPWRVATLCLIWTKYMNGRAFNDRAI